MKVGAVQNATRRRAVIVLGMHRSGTGFLTSALQAIGVDLGNDHLPPAPDNPKGFFEDLTIFSINEQILKRLGREWHHIAPLEDRFWERADLDDLLEAGANYCAETYGASPLWGFKDPRTCLLLPFWLRVLEKLDCQPMVVVALRNPMNVAASLAARNSFEPHRSYRLWMLHIMMALRFSEELPRIFVDYDTLLDHPREGFERLAAFLDRPVPSPDVMALVDPGLRHHRIERPPSDPIEDFVVAAYRSLKQLAPIAPPGPNQPEMSDAPARALARATYGLTEIVDRD